MQLEVVVQTPYDEAGLLRLSPSLPSDTSSRNLSRHLTHLLTPSPDPLLPPRFPASPSRPSCRYAPPPESYPRPRPWPPLRPATPCGPDAPAAPRLVPEWRWLPVPRGLRRGRPSPKPSLALKAASRDEPRARSSGLGAAEQPPPRWAPPPPGASRSQPPPPSGPRACCARPPTVRAQTTPAPFPRALGATPPMGAWLRPLRDWTLPGLPEGGDRLKAWWLWVYCAVRFACTLLPGPGERGQA